MQSRPKFKVSQAGVGEKTERCGWQLAKDGKEGGREGKEIVGGRRMLGGYLTASTLLSVASWASFLSHFHILFDGFIPLLPPPPLSLPPTKTPQVQVFIRCHSVCHQFNNVLILVVSLFMYFTLDMVPNTPNTTLLISFAYIFLFCAVHSYLSIYIL